MWTMRSPPNLDYFLFTNTKLNTAVYLTTGSASYWSSLRAKALKQDMTAFKTWTQTKFFWNYTCVKTGNSSGISSLYFSTLPKNTFTALAHQQSARSVPLTSIEGLEILSLGKNGKRVTHFEALFRFLESFIRCVDCILVYKHRRNLRAVNKQKNRCKK